MFNAYVAQLVQRLETKGGVLAIAQLPCAKASSPKFEELKAAKWFSDCAELKPFGEPAAPETAGLPWCGVLRAKCYVSDPKIYNTNGMPGWFVNTGDQKLAVVYVPYSLSKTLDLAMALRQANPRAVKSTWMNSGAACFLLEPKQAFVSAAGYTLMIANAATTNQTFMFVPHFSKELLPFDNKEELKAVFKAFADQAISTSPQALPPCTITPRLG